MQYTSLEAEPRLRFAGQSPGPGPGATYGLGQAELRKALKEAQDALQATVRRADKLQGDLDKAVGQLRASDAKLATAKTDNADRLATTNETANRKVMRAEAEAHRAKEAADAKVAAAKADVATAVAKAKSDVAAAKQAFDAEIYNEKTLRAQLESKYRDQMFADKRACDAELKKHQDTYAGLAEKDRRDRADREQAAAIAAVNIAQLQTQLRDAAAKLDLEVARKTNALQADNTKLQTKLLLAEAETKRYKDALDAIVPGSRASGAPKGPGVSAELEAALARADAAELATTAAQDAQRQAEHERDEAAARIRQLTMADAGHARRVEEARQAKEAAEQLARTAESMAETRVAQLQQDKKKLEALVVDLRSQLDTARAEAATAIKAEQERARAAITKLTNDTADRIEALKNAVSEAEAATELATARADARNMAAEELAATEHELAEARERHAADLRDKETQYNNTITDLRNQLDAAKQTRAADAETGAKRAQEAEARNAALATELAHARQAVADYERVRKQLTTVSAERDTAVSQLATEHNANDAAVRQLQQQLLAEQTTTAELRELAARRDADVAAAQATLVADASVAATKRFYALILSSLATTPISTATNRSYEDVYAKLYEPFSWATRSMAKGTVAPSIRVTPFELLRRVAQGGGARAP